MATIIPQTTKPATTSYKNPNVVVAPTGQTSQQQFDAAAQARNPLYQPSTAASGFDVNTNLYNKGYQFGWQDPIAQDIFDEYAYQNPKSSYHTYPSDYWLDKASSFEDPNQNTANYVSPLDPGNWGNTFQGDVMDEMAAEYERRSLAGTPAPTLAQPTGSPEGDAAAQAALASGGSYHALVPEVMNMMWR